MAFKKKEFSELHIEMTNWGFSIKIRLWSKYLQPIICQRERKLTLCEII